jgi:hypothetical protein
MTTHTTHTTHTPSPHTHTTKQRAYKPYKPLSALILCCSAKHNRNAIRNELCKRERAERKRMKGDPHSLPHHPKVVTDRCKNNSTTN